MQQQASLESCKADGAIKQLLEGDAMKIFVRHSREVDQFLS